MNALNRKTHQIQILLKIAELDESEKVKAMFDIKEMIYKEESYYQSLNDYRIQYGYELTKNREANPSWFISGYYHFIFHIDLSIEKQKAKLVELEKKMQQAQAAWKLTQVKLKSIQKMLMKVNQQKIKIADKAEQGLLDELSNLRRFKH